MTTICDTCKHSIDSSHHRHRCRSNDSSFLEDVVAGSIAGYVMDSLLDGVTSSSSDDFSGGGGDFGGGGSSGEW